ncbi:16S rRNA (uracil(1498)-N(3))-methyltransferase [Macrococcus caseolyticus]|uniref:16S rRNA (uracil(1498)-N(3))-methyltransferase n=1 Tax=Macrococcoides caseolyticum TaxID=69966 RepID=UPI0024BCE00F|nr:16S rRNA (uracil(1498)-N(3))-methyltransferase [Macrococcus caseolyticus]MDJ1154592.1 16S rRNA (uracil(1498)-N(3))-methyltransferase [Macrococcus caseolyticus]
MQRYFLGVKSVINETYQISGKDDVHHIKNVMRQQTGDKVIVNFTNATMICEIIDIQTEITVKPIEDIDILTEMPVSVTIASGLLKNDKYEWMIQKATELGAVSFIPFVSERTIVKVDEKKFQKKVERFTKIVKEAAEQSYRQIVPSIEFVASGKALAKKLEAFDHVLIAYEETAKSGEIKSFTEALQDVKHGDKVCMIFGPEGGLSEAEVAQFGSKVIGLGPRILRAETAPLYALSAMSFHFELN